MKLARFEHAGRTCIGKVVDDEVIDLSGALPGLDGSMRAVIRRLDELRGIIAQATGPAIPLTDVHLLAPIDDPQKFVGIGMNYEKHAQEAEAIGIARPLAQIWFNKQVSCINGPYDPIIMPAVSNQLDYECELGYVIGKKCRNVRAEDALQHVAGYFVANDVSVRDWQMASPTVTIGKSFDTHGPIGPWITLPGVDFDPYELGIRTLVNGEVRQSDRTSDMIHDIGAQIEHLTKVFTLEPGDLIITGTPSGVGAATGKYLKVGDLVRVEIDGLGHIENRVEAA